MKLPKNSRAVIPQRKITDYLLSLTHPDGKAKAAFFIQFGFTVSAWKALADSLRSHAAQYEVAKSERTPFGMKYTIEGPLRAPDGRSPLVRVVWFIETGHTIPTLVTAYPLAGAKK